jgi:RNA polymerase sigma-70 factor, ECF subfamily
VINPKPEEAALVQAVLAGNTEVFGTLYDRYAPVVRAICFEATGSINDSQDLTQEVFLRAYHQLSQLKDASKFGSWVVGIGRLSGRQWRRTRARDKHSFVGEAAMDDGFATAEDGVAKDLLTELYQALLQLTETERMALHLFYLESKPADNARRLLDVSLSGFYRIVERATNKLRRLLCENESEPR